jgi:hypothetical protein
MKEHNVNNEIAFTPRVVKGISSLANRNLKHGIMMPSDGLETIISVIVQYKGIVFEVQLINDLVTDELRQEIRTVNYIGIGSKFVITIKTNGKYDISEVTEDGQ